MLFKDKRQDRVIEQIDGYCDLVSRAVHDYVRMMHAYLDGDDAYKEASKNVHDHESEADVVRFNVEREMFRGAFLPSYREDYIALLETLDRVANKAEDAADLIYQVRPEIPDDVGRALREIVEMTETACAPVADMVRRSLRDDLDIQEQVEQVGRIEQAIDRVQFNAVRDVYKNREIEKVDKLVLKLVVDAVAEVSDKLENVGDRLSIIAIKRKLG